MMKAATSDLMTCRHQAGVELRRGPARLASGSSRCVALSRARGMTLFEILVALALMLALMSITIPIVASQTQRVTFNEVTTTLTHQAAVVRSESMRQTEAIWFEARRQGNAWVIGTRRMKKNKDSRVAEESDWESALLAELESVLPDDSEVAGEPAFGRADSFEESMTAFEVLRKLPTGYSFKRSLPDEIVALADSPVDDSALNESLDFDTEFDEVFGVDDLATKRPVFEAEEQRIILAVFLPDGTLIGPDQVYLFAPGHRIATVSMNRWLGAVKCESLRLSDLVVEDVPADELTDDGSLESSGRGSKTSPPVSRSEPDGEQP